MGLQNFLPLRREVMEHWVYKDSEYFKVWVEMLFKARFCKEPKKDIYDGSFYVLNYGEFLFSRPKWSQRLNVPEHKLRKLILLLEKDEMILKCGKVGKSGATIYSIKNYEKYNNEADETPALPIVNSGVDANSSQPKADETPTLSQRNANETPLKKNVKNYKNVKNVFIPPTFDEVLNYCAERNNNVDAKRFFDSYSVADWKDTNGKPVSNWKQKMIQVWEKKETNNSRKVAEF